VPRFNRVISLEAGAAYYQKALKLKIARQLLYSSENSGLFAGHLLAICRAEIQTPRSNCRACARRICVHVLRGILRRAPRLRWCARKPRRTPPPSFSFRKLHSKFTHPPQSSWIAFGLVL